MSPMQLWPLTAWLHRANEDVLRSGSFGTVLRGLDLFIQRITWVLDRVRIWGIKGLEVGFRLLACASYMCELDRTGPDRPAFGLQT